jgi:hypothetical protein
MKIAASFLARILPSFAAGCSVSHLSITIYLSALLMSVSVFAQAQGEPKVLFQSDLRGPDAPQGRQVSGTWAASSEGLRQTAHSGAGMLLLYDSKWNRPFTASVRTRLYDPQRGAESGLLLQFRDHQNYVVFSVARKKGGTYAVLRIQVDPGYSMVGDEAPLDIDLAQWHELSVDAFGPNFLASVDGKPVASFSFLGVSPPSHTNDGTIWPQDPTHGSLGLCTSSVEAEFSGFKVSQKSEYADIITPQFPSRDSEGALLPRQSYAESMKRLTEWMMRSGSVVDGSDAPKPLQSLPPYMYTNWVDSDDRANMRDNIQEFAINHSTFISGAVRYWEFSGDARTLAMARQVADWHLANVTPKDWALSSLPPSTVNWKADGTWSGQEWGLEPDKSAYMGISLVKLYAATGDDKYKAEALHIADTLRHLQRPDGGWPFRVDPKTGEVKYGYTESALWYVEFYDLMASITSNPQDREVASQSLHWLLENPVKTNDWRSFYGDVKTGLPSYDQWIPLETAMYLLDHRAEHPEYVAKARSIVQWIDRLLILNPGLQPGLPGLMEQTAYRVVLSHHQLRLAQLYARLWQLDHNDHDRRLAEQIANSVTWCLMSDGKMRLGLGRSASRIPLVLIFNDQFADLMAYLPGTAPRSESHLLSSMSPVRHLLYLPTRVNYETLGASSDVLVLGSAPVSITAGGKPLARNSSSQGWTYDSPSRILHVKHTQPDVVIQIASR